MGRLLHLTLYNRCNVDQIISEVLQYSYVDNFTRNVIPDMYVQIADLTYLGREKCLAFRRRYFQTHFIFLNENVWITLKFDPQVRMHWFR